jgi:hypothetical protein
MNLCQAQAVGVALTHRSWNALELRARFVEGVTKIRENESVSVLKGKEHGDSG